jgi:uncharacterized membrane protein required for colicin V production
MLWAYGGPTLNSVDLALLVVLVIGVSVGVTQGLIRQVFLLLACYVALVLSAQYYPIVARAIGYFAGGDPVARNTVALLLTFAVLAVAIDWVTRFIYTQTALPDVPLVDHIGGAALGLVWSWALAGIGLALLNFAIGINWESWEPNRLAVTASLAGSSLAPLISGALPYIYGTMLPWLPLGLPAPFLS